jgi:hypothetical protein
MLTLSYPVAYIREKARLINEMQQSALNISAVSANPLEPVANMSRLFCRRKVT